MSIEVVFLDAASGSELARTVVAPQELPETFAISTTVQIDETEWKVVSAEPVRRAEIERIGRLRLTVRRRSTTAMFDPHAIKFSMPTICDPLPSPDPAASLADLEVFVIDEDLWRDVEWVPRRHAQVVEAGFAEIAAIRDEASGPFPRLHLRTEPVTPLAGAGLTVADLATALGADAERWDGVVIDTLGAGFVEGGFAFRLPDASRVYGHCEDTGMLLTLGLHREGARNALPTGLIHLAEAMWTRAQADPIVWSYGERIVSLDALDAWYRSGRACTKIPW
jgi:hypothetical protein